MVEVEEWTLVVAIQAIASEIRVLKEAAANGEAEIEDLQQLEDHLQAAEDLERAYEIACRRVINLPSYDRLVGNIERPPPS